jgi:hypothetical protein
MRRAEAEAEHHSAALYEAGERVAATGVAHYVALTADGWYDVRIGTGWRDDSALSFVNAEGMVVHYPRGSSATFAVGARVRPTLQQRLAAG